MRRGVFLGREGGCAIPTVETQKTPSLTQAHAASNREDQLKALRLSILATACITILLLAAIPVSASHIPALNVTEFTLADDCTILNVFANVTLPAGPGSLYAETKVPTIPVITSGDSRTDAGPLLVGVGNIMLVPLGSSCHILLEFTYQGNLVYRHWRECTDGVCVETLFDARVSGDATDGRLDPKAIAGPVALYCDGDALSVYDTSTGDGSLLFPFSGWPEGKPDVNTLLKQVGDVALWQLTTGEFQVNADGGEGKTYAFVFNGCPYDGKGYNVSIDPNE
jgi:hypothetical protein